MVLNALRVQQTVKQDLIALGFNLNLLQALVLVAVFFEQPNPVMVTKIVDATGLSKSNVSQIVSHLESLGLLERKLKKEDHRFWLLTTTEEASNVVPQVVAYFDSVQKMTESNVSVQDLEVFFNVQRKSLKALSTFSS